MVAGRLSVGFERVPGPQWIEVSAVSNAVQGPMKMMPDGHYELKCRATDPYRTNAEPHPIGTPDEAPPAQSLKADSGLLDDRAPPSDLAGDEAGQAVGRHALARHRLGAQHAQFFLRRRLGQRRQRRLA
jgi:hypothetical protein